MKRIVAVFCLVGLLAGSVGCGSKDDKGGPKVQGSIDTKGPGPAGEGKTKVAAGLD
jgi:hypothetical protein